MCIYTYTCAYIHTHVLIYTHMCLYTHTCAYTHTHTNTHTCAYIHTRLFAYGGAHPVAVRPAAAALAVRPYFDEVDVLTAVRLLPQLLDDAVDLLHLQSVEPHQGSDATRNKGEGFRVKGEG